jgi:hypothetical protein
MSQGREARFEKIYLCCKSMYYCCRGWDGGKGEGEGGTAKKFLLRGYGKMLPYDIEFGENAMNVQTLYQIGERYADQHKFR